MKISRQIAGTAIACLCCAQGIAAPLQSSKSRTTLPETGITFSGFRKMNVEMKAPPQAVAIKRNKATSEDAYGYNLVALWRSDQIEGVWKNDEVTLTIATLNNALPLGVKQSSRSFITKTEYEQWKTGRGKRFRGDRNVFVKWLELLCDTKLEKQPKNVKGSRYDIQEYISSKSSDLHKIYVVKAPQARGSRLILSLKFSRPVKKQDYGALKNCLKSLHLFKPKKNKIKKVAAAKHRSSSTKSAKYEKSKEYAIASIRNMKNWWYIESKNYVVISNMSSQKLGKKLQERVENSRKVYEFLFPVKKDVDDVSIVRLFNKREEYLGYVGSQYKWTSGLWNASREELVVSPLPGKSSRATIERELEEVVSHEGLHQYLFYALNNRNTAPWFNEGTANFLEEAHFPNNNSFTVRVSLKDVKLKMLRGLIRTEKDNISDLIKMNHKEFTSEETVRNNYTLAWGLMFYLYKGTLVTKQRRYAKVPYIYYKSLADGKSMDEATRAAWKGVDMRSFQSAFRAFWKTSSNLGQANKRSLLKAHLSSRKRYGSNGR